MPHSILTDCRSAGKLESGEGDRRSAKPNDNLDFIGKFSDKKPRSLMPTYEYECQKCAHHFEVIQSMNDAPLKRCPKCRGRVKRLVGTGAGLIFKGSGFYSTDYRKPGYTEAAKKDS